MYLEQYVKKKKYVNQKYVFRGVRKSRFDCI